MLIILNQAKRNKKNQTNESLCVKVDGTQGGIGMCWLIAGLRPSYHFGCRTDEIHLTTRPGNLPPIF